MQILETHSHQPSRSSQKLGAGAALDEMTDEILQDWELQVRQSLTPALKLSRPILIDTLPLFLKSLAKLLDQEGSEQDLEKKDEGAFEHGRERARVTEYHPEQIVREYQLLKEVVEKKLNHVVQLSHEDLRLIEKTFDSAIQEAMASFFSTYIQHRNQTIATISHDLRNPLSVIRMSLDMILTEVNSDPIFQTKPLLKKGATRALLNVKRVDRMIQNLLDSRLLQFGERLRLNLCETELKPIAEEIISDLNHCVNGRFELRGENTQGIWDKDVLTRAIENLMSNAVKYGDPEFPVRISLKKQGERTLISVHNYGPAIPPEKQKRLFEPFQRLEEAQSSGKKGWGIGLAQARGAVEAHGGTLSVESSEDVGTTFTIDLPNDSTPYQNIPTNN